MFGAVLQHVVDGGEHRCGDGLPWADSGRGYRPSRRRPTAGAITPNQAARRLDAGRHRRRQLARDAGEGVEKVAG